MRRIRTYLAVAALLAVAVVAYGHWVGARRIVVRYETVEGGPLAEALDGLRLVVLADPHITDVDALARDCVTKVTALEPDYLILLGDYIDYDGPFDGAMTWISELESKNGGYAVLGDADYSNPRGHCVLCHRPGRWTVRTDLPVRVLRNERVVLERNGRRFAIVGFDPESVRTYHIPPKLLENPDQIPTLVLSHYPKAILQLGGAKPDLILAGDTHGGQIFLPRPLSEVIYPKYVGRYRAGWFREEGTSMYVSQGLGTSHVPIRLGVRPEITVIDFKGSGS